MGDKQRIVLSYASYAAVLLAVAAGYASSLGNELVWDDRIHILESPAIRDARWLELFGAPVGSYYRPLAFASFALDFALGGGSPAVFHLTNGMLHALVSCLVLFVATALGASRGAALAAALVFALHPVQSEAVLYVSGRPDLLAAGFGLAALFFHALAAGWHSLAAGWHSLAAGRHARAAGGHSLAAGGHARAAGWLSVAGRRFAFPAALVCWGLALASKESAVGLPLAFAVGDRLFARPRGGAIRTDLLRWASYAVALGAYAAWRVGRVGDPLVVAMPDDLPAALAGALAAVASYARLIVLPVGLHLERFVSGGHFWLWGPGLLLVAGWLFAVLRGAVATRFWLIWAAAAYLPLANLVPVYPGLPAGTVFAPEHFLYLPLTGICVAASLAVAARIPSGISAAALAVVLLLFLGILQDRAQDWRTEEGLFTHTLEYSPASARVRLNLGNLYLARGEIARAADQFQRGLDASPNDPDLLTNAGLTWLSLRRDAAAERALQRVVEIDPDDPQSWANLAALYGTTGRIDAARRAYAEALRLDPENRDAQAGSTILEERPDVELH